jgi:hypothetical protein
MTPRPFFHSPRPSGVQILPYLAMSDGRHRGRSIFRRFCQQNDHDVTVLLPVPSVQVCLDRVDDLLLYVRCIFYDLPRGPRHLFPSSHLAPGFTSLLSSVTIPSPFNHENPAGLHSTATKFLLHVPCENGFGGGGPGTSDLCAWLRIYTRRQVPSLE